MKIKKLNEGSVVYNDLAKFYNEADSWKNIELGKVSNAEIYSLQRFGDDYKAIDDALQQASIDLEYLASSQEQDKTNQQITQRTQAIVEMAKYVLMKFGYLTTAQVENNGIYLKFKNNDENK